MKKDKIIKKKWKFPWPRKKPILSLTALKPKPMIIWLEIMANIGLKMEPFMKEKWTHKGNFKEMVFCTILTPESVILGDGPTIVSMVLDHLITNMLWANHKLTMKISVKILQLFGWGMKESSQWTRKMASEPFLLLMEINIVVVFPMIKSKDMEHLLPILDKESLEFGTKISSENFERLESHFLQDIVRIWYFDNLFLLAFSEYKNFNPISI